MKRLVTVSGIFALVLVCGLLGMMVSNVDTVEAPAITPTINHFQTERDQLIATQFTLWGTHSGVIDYVKANMHNPDSFQHVDTYYIDNQTYITVTMTYRGTNAFGGIVTETITKRFTIEGALIDE